MKIIVFDLDDTLIYTECFYNKAIAQLIALISETTFPNNLSVEAILKRYKEIDKINFKQFQYSIGRIEKTFIKTIEVFCSNNEYVLKKAKKLVDSILKLVPTLIPGTIDVLNNLNKDENNRLFLFTAGNLKIQKEKVKLNNLNQYFDEIFYSISKTLKDWQRVKNILKERYKYRRKLEFISIGDNYARDIIHPFELGFRCFLVKGNADFSGYFEKEKHCDSYKLLNKLSDIFSYL